MSVETKTTVTFTNPPTFWQRIPLRLIGIGSVLLTDHPIKNLLRYRGTLWNLGCWTLAEYPVVEPTTPHSPPPIAHHIRRIK